MPDQIAIPDEFPGPGAVAGKRVVITGASRGLGTLLAHAFSRAGASVALVARTERDLKAVAEALDGPSLVLAGDVTDEDFNEAAADAVVAEWGGLDVWIANAGISPVVAGPRATEAAVWRQVERQALGQAGQPRLRGAVRAQPLARPLPQHRPREDEPPAGPACAPT
jgi:NAD(P)-dependent dehydrogenase (short-subunit alcohol dehydrogenase family)